MKTKLAPLGASLLIALALVRLDAFAQDDGSYDPNTTTYEAPEAESVVYDQPVAYYAAVVYQAPVIYNAPVYYIAAGAGAAVSYAAQCQSEPVTPNSTVVVVGGGSGTYSYTSPSPSCAPSVVIQFGQRGSSWFGR